MIINKFDYFISIAEIAAMPATCPRLSVGTVIVKNDRILSTGYNGAPSGELHCIDVGCDMLNNHCIRSRHSEDNAISDAIYRKQDIDGADLFVTHQPCLWCMVLASACGITNIYYKYTYPLNIDKSIQNFINTYNKFTPNDELYSAIVRHFPNKDEEEIYVILRSMGRP